MSEPSDRPVKITAAVRQHPAIRKLARACIELARQLRLDSPQHQSADASPAPREQADA
jgi:hypothetical protein